MEHQFILPKNKKLVRVPAFARNVVDKVGAGDALFPILAICLKSNIPTEICNIYCICVCSY